MTILCPFGTNLIDLLLIIIVGRRFVKKKKKKKKKKKAIRWKGEALKAVHS